MLVNLTDKLIRETPLPAEQISFQPGDVIGFYIESGHFNPERHGVVLDTEYSNETVLYRSIDDIEAQSIECPFPVGMTSQNYLSTNAAPVISAKTATATCPTYSQALEISILTPTHSSPSIATVVPIDTDTTMLSFTPSSDSTTNSLIATVVPHVTHTIGFTASTTSSLPTHDTWLDSSLTPLATTKVTSTMMALTTPYTDSEPPTTSSVTISPLFIGLIAGIIPLVVILTLVLTISVGVFAKYHKCKKNTLKSQDSIADSSSLTENQAYIPAIKQNEVSYHTYSTPEEVYHSKISERGNTDISTKPNEAYSMNLAMKQSSAYGVTQNQHTADKNEEYEYIAEHPNTDILTKPNEAYSMNLVVKQNGAYGVTVTTNQHTDVNEEYDYI